MAVVLSHLGHLWHQASTSTNIIMLTLICSLIGIFLPILNLDGHHIKWMLHEVSIIHILPPGFYSCLSHHK
jgi:hypothetical protein